MAGSEEETEVSGETRPVEPVDSGVKAEGDVDAEDSDMMEI